MVKETELQYPRHKYEEPIVTRYGKEVSLYKEIQASTEDATIYGNLEKYGCIDKITVNEEDVYTDVTSIQNDDHLDIYGKQQKIQELWDSLPTEIREKADYDIEKLPNVAKEFLEKQAKEQKAKTEQEPKATETKAE